MVGASVGDRDGESVGERVGASVGLVVGLVDGLVVGVEDVQALRQATHVLEHPWAPPCEFRHQLLDGSYTHVNEEE